MISRGLNSTPPNRCRAQFVVYRPGGLNTDEIEEIARADPCAHAVCIQWQDLFPSSRDITESISACTGAVTFRYGTKKKIICRVVLILLTHLPASTGSGDI
jgi:hypothetical protein